MHEALIKRIETQETWTFQECVGLAAEFSMKTRAVIAFVMMQGKDYVDGPVSPPAVDE